MWDLGPQPGIEFVPLSLGEWSLSHWTTRKVPELIILKTNLWKDEFQFLSSFKNKTRKMVVLNVSRQILLTPICTPAVKLGVFNNSHFAVRHTHWCLGGRPFTTSSGTKRNHRKGQFREHFDIWIFFFSSLGFCTFNDSEEKKSQSSHAQKSNRLYSSYGYK